MKHEAAVRHMAKTIYSVDPDVDYITVVNRDKDGRRHVVMDLDTGLTEKRPKRYKVTVLKRDAGGELKVAAKSGGKSKSSGGKKQSKLLRPMEKVTRKGMQRGIRFLQDYLYLHQRSNHKKKNGWLVQYPENVRKAIRHSAD